MLWFKAFIRGVLVSRIRKARDADARLLHVADSSRNKRTNGLVHRLRANAACRDAAAHSVACGVIKQH
jgi:hypothetical protein